MPNLHQTERNAEILRLHEAGHGPTAIGRRFGISTGRAREIIMRADRRDQARAELVARYGEKPTSPVFRTTRPSRFCACAPASYRPGIQR
jgi:hypothetical protein